MKIVSWNCNGNFRGKYKRILELDADIYVIQECESPNKFKGELVELTSNCIWEKGPNKKGVLVFSKPAVKLSKLPWNNFGMRVFIPVLVNDAFTLIAVWTTKPAYIEEFYIWQSVYDNKINENVVVIGDFNSNAIWDGSHNNRCHSEVVRKFKEKGLESVYHYIFNEEQGLETKPTFFLYKKIDRSYHIDHCFASIKNIESYEILEDGWLEVSDHLPIVFVMKGN